MTTHGYKQNNTHDRLKLPKLYNVPTQTEEISTMSAPSKPVYLLTYRLLYIEATATLPSKR